MHSSLLSISPQCFTSVKTNMVPLLFSLLSVTATALQARQELLQLEMDQAIPLDQYAVGYDCSTARLPRLRVVCDMCGADAAYTVFHGETSYLSSLYSEDQAMLARALDDLAVRFPIANYTLAFRASEICVAAHEFESQPNFHLIFSYFSEIRERDLQVPEIFTLRGNTQLDYVAIHTSDTLSSYRYTDLRLGYRAEDSFQVVPNVLLGLEYVTIATEGSAARVSYTGTAVISSQNYPFSIVLPYDREARTPFTVSVNPLGAFTALQWGNLLDNRANCQSLVPIPDLSDVSSSVISLGNLLFIYRSQANTASLLQSIAYFPLPALSPMPLLSLTAVQGQIQIDIQQHSCSLIAAGEANYTYPLRIQVVSNAEEWYILGEADPSEISISEIENSYYRDFFMGYGAGLLPQYANNANSDYLSSISAAVLSPYTLRWRLGDTLSMEIRGETNWAGSDRTLVDVLVGWVRGVVESVVVFEVSGRNDFITGDSSLTVLSSTLISSTAAIDLSVYPYMQGLSTAQSWTLGLTAFAQLVPSSACETSQFCLLLARNSAALAQFELSGTVMQDRLNLRTDFPQVMLAQDLVMTETALVLDVSFEGNTLYIAGGFSLQSESNSALHFTANLTDISGNATLYARSDSNWTTPLGVERLFAGSLVVQGTVDAARGLVQSSVIGPAVVGEGCGGDETVEGCFAGTLALTLTPSNSSFNSFTLRLNSLSQSQFLSTLLGLPTVSVLPVALAGLDFAGNSFDLAYSLQQGLQLLGPVEYYGVSGWMLAYLGPLGSGRANITIDLDEFSLGNFNILVRRRRSGSLTLSLPVQGSYSDLRSRIEGRIEFWDMNNEASLELDAVGLRGNWAGRAGDYQVEVEIRAEPGFADFGTADVTVNGRIAVDELLPEAAAVQEDLELWVEQGLTALDTLDSWKDNSTLMEAVQRSYICPQDFCPSVRNCLEIPTPRCAVRLQEQTCLEPKSTCVSPSFNCSQSASTCITSRAQCITFDSGACVDWISICEVYMDICTEWTEVCASLADQSCGVYEVTAQESECSEWEYSCTPSVYIDPGCVQRCQQTQNAATVAASLNGQFQTGYNEAVQAIAGFRSMSGAISASWFRPDLFSLSDFSFTGDLTSPGLGPGDFSYIAAFDILGGVPGTPIHSESSLLWNFEERQQNELSLLQAARTVLVETSNSTLARELITTSPLEVALERLYPSA